MRSHRKLNTPKSDHKKEEPEAALQSGWYIHKDVVSFAHGRTNLKREQIVDGKFKTETPHRAFK